MQYYNLLRESLLFIRPKYIISVHSFIPYYKDKPLYDYEVGLIYKNKGNLVSKLEETLLKSDIKFRLNEPYDMKEGFCHAQESMLSWNHPDTPEVIILNFRYDLCSKYRWRNKFLNTIIPAIQELSDNTKL